MPAIVEGSEPALLSPWGKARPAEGAAQSWHPLVYHSLDVAAVGQVLLRDNAAMVARLADRSGWSCEALTQALSFLLALHDIGKISRPFQAKVPERWPEPLLGPIGTPPADPGHPVTGAWLLQRSLSLELDSVFPGWGDGAYDLLAPFVGHHGRPVTIAETKFSEREMFSRRGVAAARAFFVTMYALFEPEALSRPEGKLIRMVSWQLAGWAVLADWIGSNQAWFPYEAPDRDPRAYFEEVAGHVRQTQWGVPASRCPGARSSPATMR